MHGLVLRRHSGNRQTCGPATARRGTEHGGCLTTGLLAPGFTRGLFYSCAFYFDLWLHFALFFLRPIFYCEICCGSSQFLVLDRSP